MRGVCMHVGSLEPLKPLTMKRWATDHLPKPDSLSGKLYFGSFSCGSVASFSSSLHGGVSASSNVFGGTAGADFTAVDLQDFDELALLRVTKYTPTEGPKRLKTKFVI